MSNKDYKSERLEYQLKFAVNWKKFKTEDEVSAAVAKARSHFLKTGDSIPGVRIIARWRNPDNRNPAHANWKSTEDLGQSLYAFWSTLGKGRGALH